MSKSDTSTPGSVFEPNFVGFSPIVTSQESADSFLASPALVGGKNKKKRKSEPKGVKMLHQEKSSVRKAEIAGLTALSSSEDEEEGSSLFEPLKVAPVNRKLDVTEERIADSTISSGDISDLDTEHTDKDKSEKKQHKKKKKSKEKRKSMKEEQQTEREIAVSGQPEDSKPETTEDACAKSDDGKKKKKKKKKMKEEKSHDKSGKEKRSSVVSSQVFSSASHQMSSSSISSSSSSGEEEEAPKSPKKKKRIEGLGGLGFLDYGGGSIDDSSQGFSPRKSTVPFSTVKSLGRGSPAKSPKRKPPQGGATETDSEVAKIMKRQDKGSSKSDTSASDSDASASRKALPESVTGEMMKSTATPKAQEKLKGVSSDQFAMLESRIKKKTHKGGGDAADGVASPSKKPRLETTRVMSPGRPGTSVTVSPAARLVPEPALPLSSPQAMETFASPTSKKRLSLSRKRKSAGGDKDATLPDLVPPKKANKTPTEPRTDSLSALSTHDVSPNDSGPQLNDDFLTPTQALFQSQSKRPLTPEIQRARATEDAAKKIRIGDVEMSPEGSDAEDAGAAQNLRFTCPKDFEEVNLKNCPLWSEEVTGPEKELWLVRVPEGLDVFELDDQEILLNGSMVIKKEPDPQHEDIVYEWETHAMPDENLQKSNLVLVLPSKEDKVLRAVGRFHGQLSVTKSAQTKPYVIPESTKEMPKIPEGLKYRLKAFGAGPDAVDGADNTASDSSKKKKKKKKHRQSTDSPDTTTTSMADGLLTTEGALTASFSGGVSSSGKKKKKKKDKDKEKNMEPEPQTVEVESPGEPTQTQVKKKKKEKHKAAQPVDTSETELGMNGSSGVVTDSQSKKKKKKAKYKAAESEPGDTSEPEFDIDLNKNVDVTDSQTKKEKKTKHKITESEPVDTSEPKFDDINVNEETNVTDSQTKKKKKKKKHSKPEPVDTNEPEFDLDENDNVDSSLADTNTPTSGQADTNTPTPGQLDASTRSEEKRKKHKKHKTKKEK